MNDDAQMLRRYAETGEEAALAEVVGRHVDLVYGVALRQTRGNAALAQDVVQVVFTELARKAAAVARHETVVGWLHTATRFAAAKAVRAEVRRQGREREAQRMKEVMDGARAANWEEVRPVIDAALGDLKERERAAILLRFFEQKPLAEVGARLAMTETAARSCVDRALDKLHAALARRGVTSTSAALGLALANQIIVAAPAGLGARVTAHAVVALSAGAGWSGGLKVALWGMAVAGVVGLGIFVDQGRRMAALRAEVAVAGAGSGADREELARLLAENRRLAVLEAEVAMLRRDDAELARLRDEAARLGERLRMRFSQGSGEVAANGQSAPIEVTIGGQIRRPARMAIPAGQPLTVAGLIAKAGGFTDTANRSKVRVARIQPDRSLKTMFFDLTKDEGDFVLETGDIVYVPEKII
jgi:RNA polymerase sigma factor (sigma-70 family)